MRATYGRVLGVPGVPRLFLTALIARLPQGMSSLAILLLVRGSTHSYAAAGIAVGAEALATAVAAPPLGRLIDRLGRGFVLSRCSVGYGIALSALVLGAELRAGSVVLAVLAFLAGACLPPIAPSVRALLRDVFNDVGARETAYALESVIQEVIWISGPLVVALVIAFCSPAVAVLILAAECVAGTALFLRAPLARDRGPARGRTSARVALSNGSLRALLPPIFLFGIALGATEVGLPALALHVSSRSATGLLLALWSVGSMTGGLSYGVRRWRSTLATRYAALLVVAVVCVAPLIAARSLGAAIVFSLLAGVTIAPVFSCQYALVGHAVEPGAETEAFTWVGAALVSGIAAGSALGGTLVSSAGFSAAFVLACATCAAAAVMAFAARAVGRRPVAV